MGVRCEDVQIHRVGLMDFDFVGRLPKDAPNRMVSVRATASYPDVFTVSVSLPDVSRDAETVRVHWRWSADHLSDAGRAALGDELERLIRHGIPGANR